MKEFNPDLEYDKAIDRSHTIDAIISLNPNFSREYLNSKSIDTLHELEDALLDSQPKCQYFECPYTNPVCEIYCKDSNAQ